MFYTAALLNKKKQNTHIRMHANAPFSLLIKHTGKFRAESYIILLLHRSCQQPEGALTDTT